MADMNDKRALSAGLADNSRYAREVRPTRNYGTSVYWQALDEGEAIAGTHVGTHPTLRTAPE